MFVQSQRRRFEIGENLGPPLFTERFDHGALGGLPGGPKFLNLLPSFGRDGEFHQIASATASTIALVNLVALLIARLVDCICAKNVVQLHITKHSFVIRRISVPDHLVFCQHKDWG